MGFVPENFKVHRERLLGLGVPRHLPTGRGLRVRGLGVEGWKGGRVYGLKV